MTTWTILRNGGGKFLDLAVIDADEGQNDDDYEQTRRSGQAPVQHRIRLTVPLLRAL